MNSEKIKVIVRVRPSGDHYDQKSPCLITSGNTITAKSRSDTKKFVFDYIASETSTQMDIFLNGAKPICDSVLLGYNGTIFVYGQTGAGKTYTLLGGKYSPYDDLSEISFLQKNNTDDNFNKGILQLSIEYLFNESKRLENNDAKIKFSCSYLEIYMEQLSDLLNPNTNSKSLEIRTTGDKINVSNLTKLSFDSVDEAFSLIQKGNKLRHIASTSMNKESSRSHAVFSIYLTIGKNKSIRSSVFHCIDLAGSERQRSTEATGDRIKEAGIINKSLMNLSLVIKTLASGNSNKHLHFRDSKLTMLLKDSLGGNAKTCIIANVSPLYSNISETISTLCFAQRAKEVKNKAIINEVECNAEQYENELKNLKKKYDEIKNENLYLLSLFDDKTRNTSQKDFVLTLDSVENEIEKMLKEISTKDDEIGKLENEKSVLEDRLNKANLDNTIKEKEIKDIETKIVNLESQKSGIEKEISDYKKENNDLTKEISNKQTELNIIQMCNNREIGLVETIVEKGKSVIKEKNEVINDLEIRKGEIVTDIRKRKEDEEKLKSEIEKIKAEIGKKKEEIEKKKKYFEEQKGIVNSIKEEIESKKKDIDEYRKKISNVTLKGEKHLLKYEEEIKKIRDDISKFESEITNFNTMRNELEEKIAIETKVKQNKEKDLIISTNKITELENKVNELKAKNIEKEKILSQINNDNLNLSTEVNYLNTENNKNLIAHKVYLLNKTKQENTKLKEELNEIKKAYNLFQRNMKNVINAPSNVSKNIFAISSFMQSKDNELNKIENLMQNAIEKLKELIPLNGSAPSKEEKIEKQFSFYFDKFFEMQSILDKNINNAFDENEQKNQIIANMRKELVKGKENLNDSISSSSRVSLNRNSCLQSSIVKTKESAKLQTNFCNKRKFDDSYCPISFVKINTKKKKKTPTPEGEEEKEGETDPGNDIVNKSL